MNQVIYDVDAGALGGVIAIVVLIVVVILVFIATRIKRCPSDKILVVSGSLKKNAGEKQSSLCIHGGTKFVLPIIQTYQYMDLTPMSISVDLKNALSRQHIRINVPSSFTVGISTDNGVMQNAAERLLRLKLSEIQNLAREIIFGQLRLIIATMEIEEINSDRDKFLIQVSRNVETELKKIGLRLINVNLTDITDESGYIDALGKEAAAKAINNAKKSVAEKNRDGSIGQAEAERDQRVSVSEANSLAVYGENKARAEIEKSNAELRSVTAEAMRFAIAAEKVASAKALEESYEAERKAEISRAQREAATQEADIIVRMEIEKKRLELQAEAKAEQMRREARGEADAIYSKMEAEARGLQAKLQAQALGFMEIVRASGGNATQAAQLMITDKIEELVRIQVEAIKNLKIDKITVWDGGSKNGESATSNFASSLLKSIPPMNEIFKMAGMELPVYLGKEIQPEEEYEEEQE